MSKLEMKSSHIDTFWWQFYWWLVLQKLLPFINESSETWRCGNLLGDSIQNRYSIYDFSMMISLPLVPYLRCRKPGQLIAHTTFFYRRSSPRPDASIKLLGYFKTDIQFTISRWFHHHWYDILDVKAWDGKFSPSILSDDNFIDDWYCRNYFLWSTNFPRPDTATNLLGDFIKDRYSIYDLSMISSLLVGDLDVKAWDGKFSPSILSGDNFIDGWWLQKSTDVRLLAFTNRKGHCVLTSRRPRRFGRTQRDTSGKIGRFGRGIEVKGQCIGCRIQRASIKHKFRSFYYTIFYFLNSFSITHFKPTHLIISRA